jgi:proteasome lid subunit RPN8/RPN11
MALKIGRQHFELLKAYGEESFPNECCGFLLGKQTNGEKEVAATFPAFNSSEDSERYHRFLITPQAYMECEKFARGKELDIIGFYHSHPNAEALPSQYDVEHGWPWYSYIIVSVINNKSVDLASWVLEDDRSKFNSEKIIVEE